MSAVLILAHEGNTNRLHANTVQELQSAVFAHWGIPTDSQILLLEGTQLSPKSKSSTFVGREIFVYDKRLVATSEDNASSMVSDIVPTTIPHDDLDFDDNDLWRNFSQLSVVRECLLLSDAALQMRRKSEECASKISKICNATDAPGHMLLKYKAGVCEMFNQLFEMAETHSEHLESLQSALNTIERLSQQRIAAIFSTEKLAGASLLSFVPKDATKTIALLEQEEKEILSRVHTAQEKLNSWARDVDGSDVADAVVVPKRLQDIIALIQEKQDTVGSLRNEIWESFRNRDEWQWVDGMDENTEDKMKYWELSQVNSYNRIKEICEEIQNQYNEIKTIKKDMSNELIRRMTSVSGLQTRFHKNLGLTTTFVECKEAFALLDAQYNRIHSQLKLIEKLPRAYELFVIEITKRGVFRDEYVCSSLAFACKMSKLREMENRRRSTEAAKIMDFCPLFPQELKQFLAPSVPECRVNHPSFDEGISANLSSSSTSRSLYKPAPPVELADSASYDRVPEYDSAPSNAPPSDPPSTVTSEVERCPTMALPVLDRFDGRNESANSVSTSSSSSALGALSDSASSTNDVGSGSTAALQIDVTDGATRSSLSLQDRQVQEPVLSDKPQTFTEESDRDSKIDALQTQLGAKQDEIDSLLSALDATQKRRDDVEKSLASDRSRFESLQAAYNSLLEEYESVFDKAQKTQREAAQDEGMLQKQFEVLQMTSSSDKRRVETLAAELEILRSRLESTVLENQRLRDEIAAKDTEARKRIGDMHTFSEAEFDNNFGRIAGLQGQIAALTDQIGGKDKEICSLMTTLDDTQARLDTAEQSLSANKYMCESLEKVQHELQEECKRAVDEAQWLQTSLADMSQLKEEFQNKYEQLGCSYALLEDDLEDLRNQSNMFKEQASEFQTAYDSIKAELESCQNELNVTLAAKMELEDNAALRAQAQQGLVADEYSDVQAMRQLARVMMRENVVPGRYHAFILTSEHRDRLPFFAAAARNSDALYIIDKETVDQQIGRMTEDALAKCVISDTMLVASLEDPQPLLDTEKEVYGLNEDRSVFRVTPVLNPGWSAEAL